MNKAVFFIIKELIFTYINMKQIFINLALLLLSISTLQSQTLPAYFDIAAHVGTNITSQSSFNNLHIKAYSGLLLGGYAGVNKGRFGIRLTFDYIPSSVIYTFSHQQEPDYKLYYKGKSNVIGYGLDLKFNIYANNKNKLNVLLGLSFLEELNIEHNAMFQNYYFEYYDEPLRRNNTRLAMTVIPENQINVWFVSVFGFEYVRLFKNVPLFIKAELVFNDKYINNDKVINFITLDINGNNNLSNNRIEWRRNSEFRLKLGTTIFRSKKQF